MRRGTRVGAAYVAVTADGSGINEEIVDSVDAAGDDIDSKGKEHGDKYGEGFSEGFFNRVKSKIGAGSSEWDKYWSKVDKRAGDGGADAGESFVERMSDKVRNLGDKVGAELSDRLASNPEQVRRGIDRAFDDDFVDRIGDRLGSRLASGMAESIDRQSSVITDAMDRVLEKAVSGNRKRRTDNDELGDVIGRMLGAGSRNNALNLFGKSIGNITGLLTKATMGAVGMFSVFSKGFSGAAEGASLFTRLGAGSSAVGAKMSASFAGLLASLPAVLIGLAAVTVALTILVSIASALLAIVVALASTIVSALVAALAVGTGAFLAFGAAIGLTTLAFTSLTNAQSKALKNAFQPLKAEATGLGQVMLRQMVPAFETWSKNLQVALFLIKPLAEVMGGAFARAGAILTESLSGRGMQMLIASLSENLPRIITNLSSAFGKFLNGVGATFAAIMPFVLRFSDYLTRVAGDFARWATSAKGQNSITDFVNRALDSLKSLWNFVKAVGGLISALLFNPRGQRAGDNIFDRMAGSLRDFTDYISTENRLENWFKRGEKFAKLLGKAIKGIGKFIEDLDNSKTIDVLWNIYKAGKWAHEQWIKIPGDFTALINPLERLMTPLNGLIAGFQELAGWMNQTSNWTPPPGMLSGGDALNQLLVDPMTTHPGFIGPVGPNTPPQPGTSGGSMQDLINAGNAALNATYESAGGYMPDPTKGPKFTHFEGGPMDDWKNPYIAFANSLIAAGPTLADEIRASAKEARATIRAALAEVTEMFSDLLTDWNKSFTDGVMDAAKSTDFSAIASSFQSILDGATEAFNNASASAVDTGAAGVAAAMATRDQMVASAEAAVQAAAQRLAGATTKKEAKAALADLKAADDALNLARQKGAQLIEEARKAADKMLAETKASQARLDAAGAILAGQAVLTWGNVNALVAGAAAENATLADYAEARRQVAEKLADATQQLTAAIALRDNYAIQVADSIRQFGSLLTAQAKVIDGVEQALNANDIVENLQDRLTKVKVFQESLRQLLALGLSQSAYKQIVDAGVETGGAYAQALLNGGQGAISQVNSLTDQFDKVATDLGMAAATEMYQAGVDAAQGLVDGLLSLSAQLDSAAAALGKSIADAIKRELGIASPSKVGYALMRDDFGDGLVGGLDAAHGKVGSASARLAGAIQVSPEVAAYATQQSAAIAARASENEGVSGNSDAPKYVWNGNIVTPTEDPHAVSVEVMNELTGRLT